jgi:hypothetical protein
VNRRGWDEVAGIVCLSDGEMLRASQSDEFWMSACLTLGSFGREGKAVVELLAYRRPGTLVTP